MTWIVGGNFFNGFACVSDIQVTLLFNNRSPKYFNCVRKIHKIHKNLAVAFSGDVRSGLIVIEKLKTLIASCLSEEEIFDLDGQTQRLIHNLRLWYNEINKISGPPLELMFLWLSFDDDDNIYRPYCWKFTAPNFKRSTTGVIGISQSGSGSQYPPFNATINFLSGKNDPNFDRYSEAIKELNSNPAIWTVRKFKNFVISQAQQFSCAGVSKSLISVEAATNWNKIHPDWLHRVLPQYFKKVGVEYGEDYSTGELINTVSISPEKILESISNLKKDPKTFEEVQNVLSYAYQHIDLAPLCQLPEIQENCHFHPSENINNSQVFGTWNDFKKFMHIKGIRMKFCSAFAE